MSPNLSEQTELGSHELRRNRVMMGVAVLGISIDIFVHWGIRYRGDDTVMLHEFYKCMDVGLVTRWNW